MARNSIIAAFAEKAPWNGVCLLKRVGPPDSGANLKTMLYIFVASAILIAACGATGAAESEKNGQSGNKKRVQVILVAKKDRDRSGESSKTETTRPRNHSRQ